MYFCRNLDSGPNSLILHKSEWNRLKKQAGPLEKPSQGKQKYLTDLIEKSQEWIKTCPDIVQGCVALKTKQRENQCTERIAQIKAFEKERKKIDPKAISAEAIQKAKQQIFDVSCYGRQLICALHNSKVLEERVAQIALKKGIKEKETELEQKTPKTVTFCTFELDKNVAAVEDQQKCITVETAKENKEIHEKQKQKEAKAIERQILDELTDAQLMKHLLDREQEAGDKLRLLEKQALEQYAAEHKKSKEERAKWEAEYYAKIETCRQEQDKLNFKIREVHQRINKERESSSTFKSVYEMVKKCQEDQEARYDFMEKSTTGEERADKSDQKAKEKEIQDRNKRMSIDEINKTMAEFVRQRDCRDNNKCFCDRQCFMTRSEKRGVKKGVIEIEPETKETPPSYLCPRNKLMAALKRREKEPSPWTGARAAHLLFMKNADQTLRECKYKIPARKVVDEYRKNNALNENTLPIPSYN